VPSNHVIVRMHSNVGSRKSPRAIVRPQYSVKCTLASDAYGVSFRVSAGRLRLRALARTHPECTWVPRFIERSMNLAIKYWRPKPQWRKRTRASHTALEAQFLSNSISSTVSSFCKQAHGLYRRTIKRSRRTHHSQFLFSAVASLLPVCGYFVAVIGGARDGIGALVRAPRLLLMVLIGGKSCPRPAERWNTIGNDDAATG